MTSIRTDPPDPDAGLSADDPAPDFQLEGVPGQIVTLSELRGRPVVLAFYAGDWQPQSVDLLRQLQALLPEIERFDAALLTVSVDSAWSHAAFAREYQLGFPLLADFEPKGAVARAYGVYWENAGHNRAAVFVIDRAGIIAWSRIAPAGAIPDTRSTLAALQL